MTIRQSDMCQINWHTIWLQESVEQPFISVKRQGEDVAVTDNKHPEISSQRFSKKSNRSFKSLGTNGFFKNRSYFVVVGLVSYIHGTVILLTNKKTYPMRIQRVKSSRYHL
jgi:hypothetical protein